MEELKIFILVFIHASFRFFSFFASVKLRGNNGMLIKTIVSTNMVVPMCKKNDVQLFEVPTGFKFIGDLVEKRKDLDFILGFEESCGYLKGDLSRDKDSVLACGLIVKAASKFDLLEHLDELYKEYGYYLEKLLNFELGSVEKSVEVYDKLSTRKLSGVNEVIDYSKGYNGVIPNDTLRLELNEGSIFVRPSGTEPKLKAYLMSKASTKEAVEANITNLEKRFKSLIDNL